MKTVFDRNGTLALSVAIVGAGPVGLALALHAAAAWPAAQLTLYDARDADTDPGRDARTLALAAGSVQLLRRLGAWPAEAAEPILQVHVSQAPPSWPGAAVELAASELGVDALGAVLPYGALVAALQRRWLDLAAAEPLRLASCFSTPVRSITQVAGGIELDAAGVPRRHTLAVVAEGGVFAEQARKAVRRDYAQTAWVGTVTLAGAARGLAVERFTRGGPLALLPLPPQPDGTLRAAMVWCVAAQDDPVRDATEAQRIAIVNALLPPVAGRVQAMSALKAFPLGLNAERTLVQGRCLRIGNAAQTLHPVAGQGLNLGLRDACALVAALRHGAADLDHALGRVEWARAGDRWSMIAATDLLARGFAWQGPGLGPLRGAALAALQAAGPARRWLARQMMYGMR